MKIVSKNFDYYDSIAYVYGEDNRIRYEREMLELSKTSYDDILTKSEDVEFSSEINLPLMKIANDKTIFKKFDTAQHFFLVVCGKLFPVFKISKNTGLPVCRDDKEDDGKWILYNQEKHSHLFRNLHNHTFMGYYKPLDLTDVVGVSNEKLIELSRVVKLPIFILLSQTSNNGEKYHKYKTKIVRVSPVLSELDFEKVYSATQLYQDIEYFIGNLLNESPDLTPVGKPPQTNEEKIVASGFDLKTSFRKRK